MKTPHFKFNKTQLETNYKNFNTLAKKYFQNNFQICFSTKTNSNKEVIDTLNNLKSSFEVASLNEIKKTPPNTFRIYNGPAKTKEELKIAIKQNILINVDSFSELNKLNELKPKEIGIRLTTNKSKFGFSQNQLKKLFDKNKNISCIQLHQGTLTNLKRFSENLKEQKEIIFPYLFKIKYIDIGGGFPDNFQMKNLSIKLEEYSKIIKQTFKDFRGTFIFEPGRYLVSDAYTLITKVIVIKEKDNINYAILDAGINILPKITLNNYHFKKISQEKKLPQKNYILAGPLLFNNDLVGKFQGHLEEGDLIEVHNVGAYCHNLAWKISYDKPK